MRIVIGALMIATAFIPVASAQQDTWAMDHGRAADAAAEAQAAAAEEKAKALADAAKTPPAPSEPTDFSVNGAAVIKAAATLSPEEQKADAAGRAAWQARCRPTVVEDREGLRRTQYAETNCDLSQFNTTGAQ